MLVETEKMSDEEGVDDKQKEEKGKAEIKG
jgi:hypothetical protein